jgi:hypothetical protein
MSENEESMDLKQAFELVLDMAEGNALLFYECQKDPSLEAHRVKQMKAIAMVREHSNLIHSKSCTCWSCNSTKDESESLG